MTEPRNLHFLQTRFPEGSFQTLASLSKSDQGIKCLDVKSHVHAALLQAINFDKVKENWYQARFHDQVKSCDALYYHNDDYYLIEFKTGHVDGLDVFRKIYDSVIGLIEHGKLTLDECRRQLNVILVANNAEVSPNAPLSEHLSLLAEWNYRIDDNFLKSLRTNDIRRLTNFLVKWAFRMTPDEFEKYVQIRSWK